MMHLATVTAFAAISLSCDAFVAPRWQTSPFGISSQASRVCLNENKIPFFARMSAEKKKDESPKPISEDDEIEQLVREELSKKKKISNLRNAQGVDYAPWMQITQQDEEKIRQLITERKRVRDTRKEQERSVTGNLYYDSQAQELSGTGLKSKIIDGNVELRWSTKSESNSKGFIVRRRAVKTTDFKDIASYENYGPLVSQGPEGGFYSYLDTTATTGGWIYRISEKSVTGEESDLCQCLVEIQTEDEQKATLAATVGIALIFVIAVVAGVSLDPMQ
mmetsp:Transcript_19169/g.27285  ORF Transcript_19169/g.27285 Transcript_19169/m.27285 type:complete len:277 (-) Transcript_19169:75-905(-)|eukprot:CAMPEP_0172423252 /NCGR_PEP_ID=MMETSP1064-20121228/14581_1 /TAXON_ID=202472 /ORGANISM="Aulacoseira subarctica , Strain CCAP 1002/5" /LENGTH=276 /DNA_ID=CAMNT_0013164515 /DNA_START=79 /DNA_END=909 /DNA_ORIENTATION=+